MNILESQRAYKSKIAIQRELELTTKYDEIIRGKDSELVNSKEQINQLLRIIEQITKVKRSYDSKTNSKSSSTGSKNSIDMDNKIVIQEQLEISDQVSVEKADYVNLPSFRYSTVGAQASQYATETHKMPEINTEMIENDRKISRSTCKMSMGGPPNHHRLALVSPTCSNTSEGFTSIYVNEMHRNIVEDKNDTFSEIDTKSNK